MIKKYFIASRPWSFPVSIAPIAIGSAVAASAGFFDVWRFVLTLIAGVSLHIVANYINTYGLWQTILIHTAILNPVSIPWNVRLKVRSWCVANFPIK